jgi:hypothetical protein
MSPNALRERREALVRFHNVYIEFLDELHKNGSSDPQKVLRLRAEVTAAVPAAEDALTVAGVNLAYSPPPMIGGPIMRGLPNTVFLHEEPGYRLHSWSGFKPTFVAVLDTVRLGTQVLEERERVERKRRRNPLYWIDRALRMTLGIPAYIVSLLVGVPRGRVEQSAFGPILRFIGVLADLAGLYGLGRLIGLY